MIRSIFTRDKPGTSDPAIGEFLADQELKFGDQVPPGTYLDMTGHLPVVDPLRCWRRCCCCAAEYDGIATVDPRAFYSSCRAATGNSSSCRRRPFVVLGSKPPALLACHAGLPHHAGHSEV